MPFYLEDDTGVLRVLPQGAETTGDEVYSEQCGTSNPIYYGLGPPGQVSGSTHERRFRESAIELSAEIYVVGRARVRQDVVAAEIARFDDAAMFLISTKSEEEVATGMRRWFWGLTIFGGVLLAVALAILHFGFERQVAPDRWTLTARAISGRSRSAGSGWRSTASWGSVRAWISAGRRSTSS